MIRLYFVLLFILIIYYLTSAICSDGHLHYNYHSGSPLGPENWHKATVQCAGRHQSPINIDTRKVKMQKKLNYVQFYRTSFGPIQSILRNIGSSVEVEIKGWEQTIRGGGLNNTYIFSKLHLHWSMDESEGSEHGVDGFHYPLEIHFVHWNSDKYDNISQAIKFSDGLAVLGVFVAVKDKESKGDKMSSGLKIITDHLKYCHSIGDIYEIPKFFQSSLFPAKKDYYRYVGSLTTPPCSESVTWTVFKQPIYMTRDQLNDLRDVHLSFQNFTSNSRPTQPINDRTIYTCCDNNDSN